MEYLIGAIAMMLFFLCFAVGYKLGKGTKSVKTESKEDKEAKKLMEEFSEVMGYNLMKALGGK